jgi:2-succinyl-5-enolpyruvyl-6-hydroxy-3-cyclohexene-1-carboxylate synthase
VATPTGLDFAAAAALYSLRHEPAEDLHAFRTALEHALAEPGAAVVHVRSDRAANVALHRRVWDAVASAIGRR